MNRRGFLLATGATVCAASSLIAQGRPPRMRVHTVTEAQELSLQSARKTVKGNRVSIVTQGRKRIITSNGVPDHKVGSFPNAGNPNRINAQSYRFEMPLKPKSGGRSRKRGLISGVAVNGVPMDTGAAEFWEGNPRSGWQYDALGGAVALGLDANYGHVQPTGAYHYHGLPIGLMPGLGWSATAASPLIGWAADGYPIYALTAEVNGQVRELRSSYRLKSGSRNGGNGPSGRHDGAFVQDYKYVAGSGDLDAHNGLVLKTAEFPEGTYAYFLTRAFPVIPRSLKGAVDASFVKRIRQR
jgi:hypothetical protein